jgi:immunoglobulin-binding protein 1
MESYDLLSDSDKKVFERYQANPSKFSTASLTDASARREAKIARFRQDKALTEKIDYLSKNSSTLTTDESTVRELYLTRLAYTVSQTFSSLENLALEFHILTLAPPPGAPEPQDPRRQAADPTGYSDRLDGSLSQLYPSKGGPILSPTGRPLQPFTLLDSRQKVADGVFRSGHNLPTMSIDEYLEEERRRGGIIEGGGAASGIAPEPDEDNYEKADAETMKARQWDEFTEANPKGAGNTMNMG